MRVSVDLPPELVWKLSAEAERRDVPTGEVIAEALVPTPAPRPRIRTDRQLNARISQRVKAGMCDADIAADLGETLRAVADRRRSMGLAANRRPTSRTMSALCTACGWRGEPKRNENAVTYDRRRHEKQCPNREDVAA